jgi:isoleucyl-tRNA synthetase
MSTVMEGREPFKTLFSYALLRDERGEEMHKSKGNAIWFDEAAERMGVDVMRWMFFRQPPANNLNFGWHYGDEIRRGFFSTLWNTYAFFVTYANIDGWTPAAGAPPPPAERPDLDRWALSELNQLVADVTAALDEYDAMTATRRIEAFVEDLSNWYVRRSRRRFWKSGDDADKRSAYATLWTCLTTLDRILAPMLPFLAEAMYQNLVRSWDTAAPESVHLCDWPAADRTLIDRRLAEDVRLVQRLASLGRSARAKANIKVRQPLRRVYVKTRAPAEGQTVRRLSEQLLEELNVKELELISDEAEFFEYQVRPNLPVLGPKYGGDVGRIQKALASADRAAIARAVAAGETVELDGFRLAPDELLVSTSGKPGFAVAEEAGYAVAVTTEITPDLADEGLARELVRRIQDMRKNAGFEIADRIRTFYDGDADVARVMEAWGEYIRQETLSVSLIAGPPPAGAHTEEHTVDGRRVTLAVERL